MKNSYKYAGIDFTGYKHGKITVIKKCDYGRSWWRCKCDCGKEFDIIAWQLFRNLSCGCLGRENQEHLSNHTRTHGMTNTRLYSVWCGMKDRCFNPNTEHYDRYGGRGITMCDEWKNSFEDFRDWAYSVGYDDNLHGVEQSIDRVDVNGNYEPSNCKWVTQKEQMRNTTKTVYIYHKGKKMPLIEFCEENGIGYHHFVTRYLKRGFSTDELLRIWNFSHGNHEGFYSMSEAAAHYGVSEMSIKKWIDKGAINGEKVGISWYIPKGQEVTRREDRDSKGQFLPGISRPRGIYKMGT